MQITLPLMDQRNILHKALTQSVDNEKLNFDLTDLS